MIVNIRVNAGYISREHWLQKDASGGGRIIGELCHFVDWARNAVGFPILSVTAHAIPDGGRYHRDNVVAALAFQDGSIANLVYLANGDRSIPKEQFEVFCEGKVGRIDDFRVLDLARDGKTRRTKARRNRDMPGDSADLTGDSRRQSLSHSVEELVEVAEATFAVEEAIAGGKTIPVASNASGAEPPLSRLRNPSSFRNSGPLRGPG